MHLFGLTGGIASGKSAASARLRVRGVPVVDADEVAREVVRPGEPAYLQIVREFGSGVVATDGTLDRKALAAIVFGDEAKRRTLNSIVHPAISARSTVHTQELARNGEPLACYDATLIVENGMTEAFRPLVVVAAAEDLQIARAVSRDALTAAEVRARLAAQMPLATKIAAADFVIRNDGTLAELDAEVDRVLAAICARLSIDVARYPSPTP